MKRNTRGTNHADYIYGTHAVTEALRYRPDVVRTLLVEPGKHANLKSVANVPIGVLNLRQMPGGISPEAVHQGIIAEIDTKKLLVPYKDFIADLEIAPRTAVAVLGEIQDPHNVGAIIRSAAAFGLSGVFIPPHRQASVTATVIKVSAGMAFRIPLIEIKNVNATVRDLKERGFWSYGLAGEGDMSLPDETFDRPSVFVVGNEGEGLREKTREVCDTLISIPIDEHCESLNASNAAAITFYEWSSQKTK